ncbi:hypothetical protein B4U79_01927 [Dinothrombium tinctorium]|uniref:Uncharacterized protein n=1 Tax=Dinothrombium tinctorium TaxID=1965070 RepID=A0A3S3P5E7_9ACAR|nr:hypothetical protein B4U79_10886 [Dinothrombium tinctorium]RWS01355.1 hypothetical protein B4U79_01927 [Dinothrombium tinctorium]
MRRRKKVTLLAGGKFLEY